MDKWKEPVDRRGVLDGMKYVAAAAVVGPLVFSFDKALAANANDEDVQKVISAINFVFTQDRAAAAALNDFRGANAERPEGTPEGAKKIDTLHRVISLAVAGTAGKLKVTLIEALRRDEFVTTAKTFLQKVLPRESTTIQMVFTRIQLAAKSGP